MEVILKRLVAVGFNTMFYFLLQYFSEGKAVGASGSWSELGEKRNAIKPFSFKYMPGK